MAGTARPTVETPNTGGSFFSDRPMMASSPGGLSPGGMAESPSSMNSPTGGAASAQHNGFASSPTSMSPTELHGTEGMQSPQQMSPQQMSPTEMHSPQSMGPQQLPPKLKPLQPTVMNEQPVLPPVSQGVLNTAKTQNARTNGRLYGQANLNSGFTPDEIKQISNPAYRNSNSGNKGPPSSPPLSPVSGPPSSTVR